MSEDPWRLVWWRQAEHPDDPNRRLELRQTERDEMVPLSAQQNIVESLKPEPTGHMEQATDEETIEGPEATGNIEQRLELLGYK